MKARFVIDFAKVRELGAGSDKAFLRKYGIPESVRLSVMQHRVSFHPGSKHQEASVKLIDIGVAHWENYSEERAG